MQAVYYPWVIINIVQLLQVKALSTSAMHQIVEKVVLDRVISGELDGSHMLMGQPLGATIGIGTKADMYTLYSMAINGKGITISNDIYNKIKDTLP